MLVAKITEDKATSLKNTEFISGQYFNPIQDSNSNWIISLVEAQYLSLGDFEVIDFIESTDSE